MAEGRRVSYLVLIMVAVTVVSAGVIVVMLYRTAIDGQRERLVETARSQARLIEAVARFDSAYSQGFPGGSGSATLSQIIDAHDNYAGFGETGEFTLARLEENDIVFLLSHRHEDLEVPSPVPFDSELAEPMRQALLGRSGSIVALDYRGVEVLAAHEPVAVLNLGIVAKIDMSEVRAPFLRAGLAGGGTALVVVLLGTVVFLRVSNPIVRRLKEYSNQLEVLVTNRTRQLSDAQQQLVRSERLAALGELAGGVGHELRNPLGAIKNAHYFLNMTLDQSDPEVRETLGILEREVTTAEGIITSLLDYARAQPPMRRKANVNEIVRQAMSRVEIPQSVTVIDELDGSLPPVMVDPAQLIQVFTNIALNAVQAMPDGGQLTLHTEARGDDWTAISFTDDGVGITPEDRDKLFEPLFTRRAKGIGLGLSITKMLVEGHGGNVEVASAVGRGSKFTVLLPAGAGEMVARGKKGQRVAGG
ncbi:MAG: ATP-binding protein [Dehalococcoidales bacterium]